MKIAVRIDDITPTMDWAKFLRFKELCDKYHIRPLLGVIPDNKDVNLRICEQEDIPVKDFWAYIRQLEKEGWAIAQHGVYHVYTTNKMGCFPLNGFSEFAGICYDQQYGTLRIGRDALRMHGINTDIFMAPAHSFDWNTLRALKKLGFHKITDGLGDMPYSWRGLVYYPISYRQESSLKKKKGYTTFVVHTNTMGEKDFQRYERLFENCKDRLISYTDLLKVQPQKRGISGAVKEYVMALAKFAIVRMRRQFESVIRKKQRKFAKWEKS